jgi:DNA-binding MarR family transcriptional regulator
MLMIMPATRSAPVHRLPEGDAEPLPASLTRYTGFLLAKAHQRLFTRFADQCRRQAMDVPGAGVLHLLKEAGPMSQQHLGRKLRIDRTTMVKLVDGLEKAKLARRKNHPGDRRAYLVEITPAGSKALAAVGKIADRMESELLVQFTESERKLIRRALLTLAG